MEEDPSNLNLKYQAFIKESEALNDGFRHGILSLCESFFSKNLLTKDLKDSSYTSKDETIVTKKVLSALQSRVKADSSAFDKIVKILHSTTSMEYLAKKLENTHRTLHLERKRDMAGAGHHDSLESRPRSVSMEADISRTTGEETGGMAMVRCHTEPGTINNLTVSFVNNAEERTTSGSDSDLRYVRAKHT